MTSPFNFALIRQNDECCFANGGDDIQISINDDSIVSLFQIICDRFEESGIGFHVEGFGQSSWPVDVHTDLVTLLEQLPEALEAWRRQIVFEFDFYEQGIERTVVFEPNQDAWGVKCISRTEWSPKPETCKLNDTELEQMFSKFVSAFLELAEQASPQLTHHEWFQDWRRRVAFPN